MSCDYSTCFGIGRYFREKEEVVDWFLKNYQQPLSAQAAGLIQADFDYFLRAGKGPLPTLECLDLFAGYPWALMFPVSTDDIDTFKERFSESVKLWSDSFGEQGYIVNEVIVS